MIILLFGTVLPLINFIFTSNVLINLCYSTSIVAILLSMIYILFIFWDENDNNIHKFSNIIYEGKNDF